ncbi:SAVED domain-containing protein [Agrobacterium vitis]|uniref:SAVED domain-containing protein n=1 Tax=Agrobacterium vitis TaxID=373 RepID=A0AAE4WJ15_AGRVI|nr:SAVED domain-containing protein [Agrobacterium vitis]MCF1497104.1 SAVED domain-containing protein [Allorhizobium sp. Av2]MCM2443453.1 SAVED domain-containing protein [Agrobacterium vitis]MUZ60718.1 SAVED domain-containing protein [Agrobacterium vitis]MVA68949.1 SAVED domain-containing protein [Agrobacterium vitis]MVA90025.1 SAVED domain-containing protein [Agrobacterium vitis]
MFKFIRPQFTRSKTDTELPGDFYKKSGKLIIVVGLAIIAPGPVDAILSFVNNKLHLGLSLDAPWWIGLVVMVIGVALLVLGYVVDREGTHKGQFVAIRHQSFQPLAGTLPKEALPTRMRRRSIQSYDCELSALMTGSHVNPKAAVIQQQNLATHIAGIRRSDPNAALGYYGIVHIPLQFLAGCSISSYPEVVLFEHDRSNGSWVELKGGNGPMLNPEVIRSLDPAAPTAAVIRIEVSYCVAPAEIAKIIPPEYREYRLAIAQPGIDKITHYGQVEAICVLFRTILDEIQNDLGNNVSVHVFYAGPVSLGFSLGRRISRTIHTRVFVYNYTAQSNPAYSWGIDVTRDAPAEAMVVTPQLI